MDTVLTDAELSRIVISCDEDSQPFAEAELCELFPGIAIEWHETISRRPSGVGIASVADSFDRFAEVIGHSAPIFLRHIAPAHREVPLLGADDDVERLRDAAVALAPLLSADRSFSVQTRLIDDGLHVFPRVGLNRLLSETIGEVNPTPLETRQPDQVVSVVCAARKAYLGVSRARQNVSAWPGGQRRYRRDDDQISRAEFKLMEAVEIFGLDLPRDGRALDIGAAPGGWTRVLRGAEMNVVAVDPAELHASLAADPRVTHVRERAQTYRPEAAFDVIVNDMKMDARDSIAILLAMEPHLHEDGIAVITLKLPKSVRSSQAMLRFVRDDLAVLANRLTVIGARQLFHNRNEITVALRKPASGS